MRCRSLVILVEKKSKTKKSTKKNSAWWWDMSERQSHCLFSRQSGAEVLRNNRFYQKPALSFTIQYTSPVEKKVIVISVLQLNLLLKCYDTPESVYYFTTVHWRVGVNCVFDLVWCQIETVGIGLIAFSASRYFIKKKRHYREMSAMLAFVLNGLGTRLSRAQNKRLD